MQPKLTRKQAIQKANAVKFAKKIDKLRVGNNGPVPVHMDASAPCGHCHGTGKRDGEKCEWAKCPICATTSYKAVKVYLCPSCESELPTRASGWGECGTCGLSVTRPIVTWDQQPISELCQTCNDTGFVRTCNGRGRIQLDALGAVRAPQGKANGLMVTPSAYAVWVKAGKPAHPVFNVEAWRTKRHVNNVALPTCGPAVLAPAPVKRHEPDCTCAICAEFKRNHRVHVTPDTFTNEVLSPVPYGPKNWYEYTRPNGLVPPLRA